MPLTIQPLPIDVVHLIGAGEVIDSPSAVVRELAENAVDAGATRIAIAFNSEQWSVRVADNGHGMGLDDLQQAAQPHATSKIQGRHDLTAVGSLGFRGEALHSLAQLAELEIKSYQLSNDEGWCVRYDAQGDVIEYTSVAIAPGTIVEATRLFSSWLKRRDAMPSTPQQLRQIQLTVQHLALCHPTLTWTVTQGDRDWFSIFPGQTPKTILPQFLRDVQPDDLRDYCKSFNINMPTQDCEQADQSITSDHLKERPKEPANVGVEQLTEESRKPNCQLYLLLGLPDRCHRRRSDWIKVAINGRMIQLPELEQVIIGAFRRTLLRDRYPVCFVHLTVPFDHVDWNRHPAKREVYLHHLDKWQEHVKLAIVHILRLHASHIPDRYFSGRITQLIKASEQGGQYDIHSSDRSDTAQAQASMPHAIPGSPTESQNPQDNTALSVDDSMSSSNASQILVSSDTALMPIRAIAQVHQMYILAEHPDGMWLIEQHIAHERILYEQLCDRWQLLAVESPVILSRLSSAQLEQLHRLNLDIESFGDGLWAVRTVPASLAHREDCADALIELSMGGDVDTALVATACRTAIRNGTPLTKSEMQTILDQWQRTRNPRTCPHGRPIYLALEESRLSRFFRRHWVIGKSHGI